MPAQIVLLIFILELLFWSQPSAVEGTESVCRTPRLAGYPPVLPYMICRLFKGRHSQPSDIRFKIYFGDIVPFVDAVAQSFLPSLPPSPPPSSRVFTVWAAH